MARKRITAALAVAAVAAGGYFVDQRATEKERAAEAAYPPIGQFLDVNGVQVHALVRGEGPDVVLIHGAGGNLRDFDFAMAARLADRYRVIMFDRPGLGYTGRIRDEYDSAFTSQAESPAEQAALLQAAAAQLGAEKPIVVGHSYGGAVAYAWAVYHPENISGVVSLAGVTLPWPGGLGAFYTIPGSTVGGAIVPPLATAFVSEDYIQNATVSTFFPNEMPEGYDTYIGGPLAARRATFRANTRQVNSLRPFIVEQSALYPDITVPVEMIHGDEDTSVPLDVHSRPASEIIPTANLTVLEGVGHMPHHIRPDVVTEAIDRIADQAGLR